MKRLLLLALVLGCEAPEEAESTCEPGKLFDLCGEICTITICDGEILESAVCESIEICPENNDNPHLFSCDFEQLPVCENPP